jgi:hypothetical protein
MEKQERVVDPEVIDEVMKLPFHKVHVEHRDGKHIPLVTRELVERAAALEDNRESDCPKLLRDLRCAYELILDHKHTRLRVMEVARAIKEAASATPPAFSPGSSRGATPGGHYNRYGQSSSYHYSSSGPPSMTSSSHSPVASPTAQQHQARLAEEAARALMQTTGLQQQHSALSSSNLGGQPPQPPSVVQMTSSIPGNVGMIAQHQHGRRNRRWYLGIQSKKDPAHVMTEVYKALMALGCEWMQLSSYRIKCRWRPNFPRSGGYMSFGMPRAGGGTPEAAFRKLESDVMDTGEEMDAKMKVISGEDGHYVRVPNLSTPDYCIKIGLTLYKVQQSIYLLDFQKMTGDAFSFMTLCANIITELKTLSAASKQQQQQLMAQQAQMQQQGYPPLMKRD